MSKHLSIAPGLSPGEKSLLSYFVHAADSFSYDKGIKDEFCGAFIPIAMDSYPLMASILTLAAVHRANAGLFQGHQELAALQVTAVRQLRMSLSGTPNEALVASALILCYAEVISGGGGEISWRVHLEGVAHLFALDPLLWTVDAPDRTRAFICRCFVSLVALANVSRHPPTAAASERALAMIPKVRSPAYIDEFTAYSTDLTLVLFEVGNISRQSQLAATHPTGDNCVDPNKLALHLLHRLEGMTVKSHIHALEHLCINTLFHQAAKLQIFQRMMGLLPSSTEVQQVVRSILRPLSRFRMHRGPGVGVLLFFPVFSAGTGAIGQVDRQHVRDMLTNMIQIMGFANIRQGLDVLEALWLHRDLHGESNMNSSWEGIISKFSCLLNRAVS